MDHEESFEETPAAAMEMVPPCRVRSRQKRTCGKQRAPLAPTGTRIDGRLFIKKETKGQASTNAATEPGKRHDTAPIECHHPDVQWKVIHVMLG